MKSKQEIYLWDHPQVGDNRGHFNLLKHLISETFYFWRTLETGGVTVVAEMVNEDEESTSYLITVTGNGIKPIRWTGEICVNNDNEVSVWYGEDSNPTNPDHLRNVILFQLLHGYDD